MRPVTKVIVTPIEARVDDGKVTIVEVTGYTRFDGEKRFIVSCFLEWEGYKSQLFHLDVKDGVELERKLKLELAKMKLAVMAGYAFPFTRVG